VILLRQYNALQARGRAAFIQNEYFVMAAERRSIWPRRWAVGKIAVLDILAVSRHGAKGLASIGSWRSDVSAAHSKRLEIAPRRRSVVAAVGLSVPAARRKHCAKRRLSMSI
jgi:hypothetical protein